MNENLLKILCVVYNSGYKSGQRDTVESEYSHISYGDFYTYHKEEVVNLLEEMELEGILK